MPAWRCNQPESASTSPAKPVSNTMKTTKSIIVVLFVLLTAQIASAYYCPSTGRWLSRDPIGEPGFQAMQTASSPSGIGNSQPSGRWINRDRIEEKDGMNLFGFINGNPINLIDALGLKICEIRIYAGHNYLLDEKTGDPIPGSGLEGFYQDEVAHNIEKRKCSDKIGFVGCGMNGLNGISNQQGFGIPGMPSSRYPFLPSSYDLEWSPYLSSDIGKAVKAAEALAKNMCNGSGCCCSQINIGITFSDAETMNIWARKYKSFSEIIKCNK